ncbi:MAG: molecular chaperone HtpG [Proteobacteria bacterium]|nr:molecular chaperone HtpG [Pseudomonadota bacterium]
MTTSASKAKSKNTHYEFKTDVKQLLDLVTHSLYSHKDIFLRELISNASDAIDKVRFESLTNADLLEDNSEWQVEITPDEKEKTLTIKDNGCGMSREDLIDHIGTIAKSGTQDFIDKIKESKKQDNPDLIGQFGVGFYSSFMVADKVTVRTRTAGGTGWQWVSTGEASFDLDECDKQDRGTEVVLHLKEECEDYLQEYTIRETVKKYSNFVEFPICMEVERNEYPKDKDGNDDYKAEPKKVKSTETLNSAEAIWMQPKSEIKKEDYSSFYKQISHDFQDPMETIHYSAEGAMEYKALMYLPSKAPQNIFSPDSIKGMHLYINRVFIMNDCKKLLPEYLRFVNGVVDSSDLPLNVSREILQDNPQLEKINKGLVNKLLSTLKTMKNKKPEEYLKFYNEFGMVLKEGLHYDQDNKEKLMELVMFPTTKTAEGEFKSLKDYVDGMKKNQKEIYYISAENRAKALNSPHLELYKSKNMEVLLMIDNVDEYILPQLTEYDKKPIKSVTAGAESLKGNKEKEKAAKEKAKELGDLLTAVKEKLGDDIKEVKFSGKLTESACCLTADDSEMNAQMAQMMRSMGQAMPDPKKILELNPTHPLIDVLNGLFEADKDSEQFGEYVGLIYEQALLTEGSQLKDPLGFAKKVSELMVKAQKA